MKPKRTADVCVLNDNNLLINNQLEFIDPIVLVLKYYFNAIHLQHGELQNSWYRELEVFNVVKGIW